MKQELRWAKKNTRFSSFCFQQRTWACAQIYPSKWEQKPPEWIVCFGAFMVGEMDRYDWKMRSTWQSDPSMLHQPPSLARPGHDSCHCKRWICPDRSTDSSTQASESRIYLIVFERRVLNILQGRWSEWWNNQRHWRAWIINLGSRLEGSRDLASSWALQLLLSQMKWNWTGACELELLNQ